MSDFQKWAKLFKNQQSTALTLRTAPVSARKVRLKQLGQWIRANRSKIHDALWEDMRKSQQEADICEIFPLLQEIKKARKHLTAWSRPKTSSSSLTFLGTSAQVICEPKGVCLIIAPWNYPFLLTLGPLVSALAAGNTVFLKPSEYTPHTSRLIRSMTSAVFEENEVVTAEGDHHISQFLLSLPFDHIFFTGSPTVGKIVMREASKNLSSVTLELGGKSPTIVDQSADIKDAATKIAWGKWLNAGQTCVAPDYILAHHSIKNDFIETLREEVKRQYGTLAHYTAIVNEKHFDRLEKLKNQSNIEENQICMGGGSNRENKSIEPTIIKDVTLDAPIMQEEIFGPLLPVIEYESLEDAILIINERPKPLALYIFAKSRKASHKILKETSSGTGVINDSVLHFAHPSLPFGGVNGSGFGRSHGEHGFLAFSNQKSVLKQRRGLTVSKFLYPPYTPLKNKLIEILIKYF